MKVGIDTPSSPVEMAYTDTGNTDAPHTLLLLHGLFDHKGTWEQVGHHLRGEEFRLVAPDLIGSGRSSKPAFAGTPDEERYSGRMQAAYLREFVRQLELEHVIIAGNSLGGGLALYLACSEWTDGPQLRGLILIAAAAYPQQLPGYVGELAGWPGGLLTLAPVRRLAFGLGIVQSLVSLTQRRMFFDPSRIPSGLLETAIDILRSEGIFYAHRETARNVVPRDADRITELYGRLDCPALIICGREDRVVPALNALRLEADIRASTLHVFDECGHVPHLEYPQETAAVMRDWVRHRLPTGTKSQA